MTQPKVFISYSWDSEDHKSWVRHLATKLQENGVKVFFDQWDTYPGIDILKYMETSIREVDFVLLICTPNFAKKANSTYGGVGYEKMIVTGEIYQGAVSPRKFVPLLRRGSPEESLPSYLKSRLFIDFREDRSFDKSLEELLRHIHQVPKYVPPPVGIRPSFQSVTQSKSGTSVGKSDDIIYCSHCGKAPGSYSSCIGGKPHNFVTFKGEPIYCSHCGKAPGSYSSCIGGTPHNFIVF